MLSYILTATTLVVAATASFEGNLNYRSPSLGHPSLGLDVPKIERRQLDHAISHPHLVPRAYTEKRQSGYASSSSVSSASSTSSSASAAYSLPVSPETFSDSQLNFTHGVASGDPYSDSVILWTRLAPSFGSDRSNVTVSGTVPLYSHDTEQYIRTSSHKVCSRWQISSDKKFRHIADHGTAYTTSDIDFTIKVEAKNLKPFTQYYYQFTSCANSRTKSPVGKTKSAPAPDDDVTGINLAVYSCSNYPNGYFNAYGNPARKNSVDYVLHLGDYICTYSQENPVRSNIPAHSGQR